MAHNRSTTVGLDPVALGLTRATLAALYSARRAIRLYPRGHRVREASLEEFGLSALCAVRTGSIELGLGQKRLLVGGHSVFEEPASEGLIRALAGTGIRTIQIRTGVREAELSRFVALCADPATYADTVTADWTARVWSTEFPNIRFSADSPRDLPEPQNSEHSRRPLSSLAKGPFASTFAAAVAREATINLPVQVASALLELTPTGPPERNNAIYRFLETLLHRLLRDFDLQSAAWLLEEAQRQQVSSPVEQPDLLGSLHELEDREWWLQCIASPTGRDPATLSPFVLHHGRDALPTLLDTPDLLAHAELRVALQNSAAIDANPFLHLLVTGTKGQQSSALELLLDTANAAALLVVWPTIDDPCLRAELIERLIQTATPEVFECLRHTFVEPRQIESGCDEKDAERVVACLASCPRPAATELLEQLTTHGTIPVRAACNRLIERS